MLLNFDAPKRDDPKKKDQERASSDFNNFFLERQLNLLVMSFYSSAKSDRTETYKHKDKYNENRQQFHVPQLTKTAKDRIMMKREGSMKFAMCKFKDFIDGSHSKALSQSMHVDTGFRLGGTIEERN